MDRILRNFLTLSQPDPRIDSAPGDPTEYSI
jgi:homoserine O-acetyltransferase